MKELPITVKRSIELVGIVTAGALIAVGKIIIMPILLALFLSVLLMPLFRLFRKWHLPEIIAISFSIICLAIFVSLIGWLFYTQFISLLHDFPAIQENLTRQADNLSNWISQAFGFAPEEQTRFINEHSNRFFNILGTTLQGAFGSVKDTFIFFGLLPIYIFLILLYRHLFLQFTLMWIAPAKHEELNHVIPQLESTIKRYLFGLLIQFTYIIVLLGGALLLLGIKHGLLIGILFAFLNLIPYLGPLIGNILGILITLASSGNLSDIIIVFAVIAIVQFLDNNILMPRIVGRQVRINALVSIVAIFIGGALAGVSGMFLAMPVIAVLKIIFEHSEQFKQWAVLFGDVRPVKNPTKASTRPPSTP